MILISIFIKIKFLAIILGLLAKNAPESSREHISLCGIIRNFLERKLLRIHAFRDPP